jgi:ribonucleoside-triphosphate reductase
MIRRSALITIFSHDDQEMLSSKSGTWWELNPQRGRSNNSVNLIRHKMTEDGFFDIWKQVQNSGAGEPGFYLSNDKEYGPNPSVAA